LDMARTVVNVSGDLVATTVIANSEGELNIAHYNADIEQSALIAAELSIQDSDPSMNSGLNAAERG